MKTPRSHRSRVATFAAVSGLALAGALGVGSATQALFAGTADVTVADDSGSDSKPKPDGGCTCEE